MHVPRDTVFLDLVDLALIIYSLILGIYCYALALLPGGKEKNKCVFYA